MHDPPPCTLDGRYVRGSDGRPPYRVDVGIFKELSHCRRGWQNWTWSVPSEPECSRTGDWCVAFDHRSVLFVGDSLMVRLCLCHPIHRMSVTITSAPAILQHN